MKAKEYSYACPVCKMKSLYFTEAEIKLLKGVTIECSKCFEALKCKLGAGEGLHSFIRANK